MKNKTSPSELRKIMEGDFDLEVHRERENQDVKWGEQNHNSSRWMMILGEEYGEMQKALLEGDMAQFHRELIQTAAVCKAIWECSSRNNWREYKYLY